MRQHTAMAAVLAMVLVAIAAGALGAAARPAQQPAHAAKFAAIDVFVDSGAAVLAAWQVEVKLGAGAKLAGVEGGDAAGVYAAPPTYDPAALMGGRVIIASFSREDAAKLPAGRTRVARLHVQLPGGGMTAVAAAERFEAALQAAADAEGKKFEAKVQLAPASPADAQNATGDDR